jgi:N-acetylglucosaminyl-diphospho-decaprenol L-rhamnosyltransferase
MDTADIDPTAPLITVVVVNYNSGGYLRGCLASLARQTIRDFEVIVVDNDSSDDSLDRIDLAPPGLAILRERTNHGFARANNLAARRARGRWLALLNPDAEADPDWLERLLEATRLRPDHRIVASLQVDLNDPSKLDGAGDCYLAYGFAWRGGFGHALSETPSAGECFAACGAALFLPTGVFLAAGGFEERYFCYHEDVDLGFRLRLMGELCQFDPACRVRHAGSGTSGRHSDFSVFHGARNAVWTYVRNMPGPLLLLTMPVYLLMTLALVVRSLLAGRGPATVRGLVAALTGLAPALAARARLKAMRRTNVAGIARAMSWDPRQFLQRRPVVRPFTGRPPQE